MLKQRRREEKMWVLVEINKKGEKNWDSVCDDDEESKLSSSRRVSFLGFSNGLGG